MAAELEYYKEQLEHGRHIEVQRSTVAALAATSSGAIIGELLKQPLTRNELPYTVTLSVVGLVSWLLSAKLYERFRLHNYIAKLARDRLDATLKDLRKQAEKEHKKDFPFTYWLPLHHVWNVLFAAIMILGIVLTVTLLRS